MNSLINVMAKSRLFNSDLDYHLVRASMVIIYLLFGYQKWWEYEAQTLSDGHYRQLEQYYNTHRVKLPENHTNIAQFIAVCRRSKAEPTKSEAE